LNFEGDVYYDVYSFLITLFINKSEEDGIELISEHFQFLTRKHLKKTVMTSGYGVTSYSSGNYFINSVASDALNKDDIYGNIGLRDTHLLFHKFVCKTAFNTLYSDDKTNFYNNFELDYFIVTLSDAVVNLKYYDKNAEVYTIKELEAHSYNLPIYSDEVTYLMYVAGLKARDLRPNHSILVAEIHKRLTRVAYHRQRLKTEHLTRMSRVSTSVSAILELGSNPQVWRIYMFTDDTNGLLSVFKKSEFRYEFNEKETMTALSANYIHSKDAELNRYLICRHNMTSIHDAFSVCIDDVPDLMDDVNSYFKSDGLFIIA
jgi:hypothetical protein